MVRFTKVKASSLGAVLDCDLNTGHGIGGGTATDNTDILNDFLSRGTANHPVVLEIDGPSLIRGLYLPTLGHASIVGLGWDTGFYVTSGSNADAIHNGGPNAAIPTDPDVAGQRLPPASSRGSNVTLSSFRINGNRGNGTTGNSNSGKPQGNFAGGASFLFGINLMNLDNIQIEGVWCYDIATYSVRLSNCGQATVRACRFESPTASINCDGVHLNGGCNDIFIDGCWFQTGDDSVALNAPEGYGGPITRVVVTNCIVTAGADMMRIYTHGPGGSFQVSRVLVANCSAAVYAAGFQFGFQQAGGADAIADVTISNCVVEGTSIFACVNDNIGTLKITGCTVLSPPKPDAFLQVHATVSSLTVSNCSIFRNPAGNAPAFLLSGSPAIERLTIDGFAIESQAGQSFPAIPALSTSSGHIRKLILNALDMTGVAAFTSNWTAFTTIAGPGVMATGLEFPDDVISDGTPYLSANSRLPSIKIAGKVKTLSGS